jgi:hypothetical protein
LQEGWRHASIIPIRVQDVFVDVPGLDDITEASLAFDEWLQPPLAQGPWNLHIKVSKTYALFYYSTSLTLASPKLACPPVPLTLVESVAEVLFVKLRDHLAIDVEDGDVTEVLQDISLMF